MEDNELLESQRLVIRVNYLSSTTSFALDTLAQHRVVVGQLQDEVGFLRIQIEFCRYNLLRGKRNMGLHPLEGTMEDCLPWRQLNYKI
jgi:hypothetical protein